VLGTFQLKSIVVPFNDAFVALNSGAFGVDVSIVTVGDNLTFDVFPYASTA